LEQEDTTGVDLIFCSISAHPVACLKAFRRNGTAGFVFADQLSCDNNVSVRGSPFALVWFHEASMYFSHILQVRQGACAVVQFHEASMYSSHMLQARQVNL
jgi:hypothetical protein